MPDFFPVSFSSFHKHKLHGSRPPHLPLSFPLVMQKWKKKNRKNLQTFIFASFCSFCRVSPSCLPSFVILATSSLRGQICVLEQVTSAHTHTQRQKCTHAQQVKPETIMNLSALEMFLLLLLLLLFLCLVLQLICFCLWKLMKRTMCQQLWFIFTHPPTSLPQPSFKAGGGVSDCVVVCLAGAGHHLPPAH